VLAVAVAVLLGTILRGQVLPLLWGEWSGVSGGIFRSGEGEGGEGKFEPTFLLFMLGLLWLALMTALVMAAALVLFAAWHAVTQFSLVSAATCSAVMVTSLGPTSSW